MFTQLSTLNKDRHSSLRVGPLSGFLYAKDLHVAAVTAHEFARAAAIYPVLFIKNEAAGFHQPVVLLGLDSGHNLFVDETGRWNASYVPAVIRRYPFALAQGDDPATFTVCVDEGSDLVGREVGVPLFTEQGEPAEALQNVVRYLSELQQMDAQTQAFCVFLAEHDLLMPVSLQVQAGSDVKNINGAFAINEAKLASLPDDLFLQMRQRGYLQAAYAQLLSLGQLERLMLLQQAGATSVQQATDPVVEDVQPA